MTDKGKNMVDNNYRISRRIGGGSFGEIYLGIGPGGDQGEYLSLVTQQEALYGSKICP